VSEARRLVKAPEPGFLNDLKVDTESLEDKECNEGSSQVDQAEKNDNEINDDSENENSVEVPDTEQRDKKSRAMLAGFLLHNFFKTIRNQTDNKSEEVLPETVSTAQQENPNESIQCQEPAAAVETATDEEVYENPNDAENTNEMELN
jgi:hypothetical protein